MITRFSDEGEFIDELKSRPPDAIIRVTRQYVQAKTLPLHSVYVVATYIRPEGLFMLQRYCGQCFSHGADEVSRNVMATSDRVMRVVEEAAKRLHLAIGAGVIEEEGSIKS